MIATYYTHGWPDVIMIVAVLAAVLPIIISSIRNKDWRKP